MNTDSHSLATNEAAMERSGVGFDMNDCPKFIACSSPLCPLDPDLGQRTYLKGEPICFYVRGIR